MVTRLSVLNAQVESAQILISKYRFQVTVKARRIEHNQYPLQYWSDISGHRPIQWRIPAFHAYACKYHELCDSSSAVCVTTWQNALVVKFTWPDGLEFTDSADSGTNTLQHRLILWVSLWTSFLWIKIFLLKIPSAKKMLSVRTRIHSASDSVRFCTGRMTALAYECGSDFLYIPLFKTLWGSFGVRASRCLQRRPPCIIII